MNPTIGSSNTVHPSGNVPPATVMIVDDSRGARKKLALAVGVLGHATLEASSGREALDLLADPDLAVDLVLLDIVMPELDGFAVLREMRADERLREVPVVVVSGVENEPGAVIDAIRLGAFDFLPKDFESVLLKARIGAALRRKRNRDLELAELSDVRRLTEVAILLETSLVDNRLLGLDDIVARGDALGRFAAVFSRMAVQMHARERQLRRRLIARRSMALLILAGVLFGMSTPLSKVITNVAPNPTGLSLWVNFIAATFCMSVTAWRGRWPRWTPELFRFLVFWGLIGAALSEVLLFTMASRLPATTLSVILVLEGFLVFALSALVSLEKANGKRLFGLFIGMVGVVVVMQSQAGEGAVDNAIFWIVLALSVPLCYAFEDLLIAARMPPDADIICLVGFSSVFGVLFLAPVVWYLDDAVALSELPIGAIAALTGISLTSLVATVLQTRLLSSAGAVFSSQVGYIITLAGIVWSMLLLGERPATALWIAVGIMFIGLVFVEPKREPEDVLDVGVFGPGDASGGASNSR